MTTPRPAINKDAFHLERSRFLDAFAALEEAMSRIQANQTDGELGKQIKALRLIRNDIVHTQLKFVQLDGQLHVLAVNSQHATDRARAARLIKLNDLQSLSSELNQLTRDLEAA